VDVSDVTKLKTAISAAQTEAKKLSETLTKFDDRALKAVRGAREEIEKLQRALGSSGARGVTGPKPTATGSSSGVGGSNMHAGSFSGAASVGVGTGGSSYLPTANAFGPGSTVGGTPRVNLLPQGAGPGPTLMQRAGSYLTTPTDVAPTASPMQQAVATPLYRGVAGMVGAATSIAGLAAGHLDDATSRSYLINQMALAGGGGMGMSNQLAINRGLGGQFGNNALSYADVSRGTSALAATGAIGGAAGAARFQSAGFMAAVNPTQGVGVGAQQVAQTFTSQNFYAQRIAGVQMNPNNQNMSQLFDQIISRYTAQVGRQLTTQEIQSAAQQGSPLNVTVTAMGLTPDVIQNFIRYWQAHVTTGKRGTAAMSGVNRGTLFRNRQQVGAEGNRALSNLDTGFMPGAADAAAAKAGAIHAMGDLANTPFGHAMGEAAGGLSVFAGELKTASGALKTMTAWMIARGLLGGGRGGGGGGGIGGAVGGRLGGVAGRIGGAFGGAMTSGGISAGAGYAGVGTLGAGIVGGAVFAAPAAIGAGAVLAVHGQMTRNQEIKYGSAGSTAGSLSAMIIRARPLIQSNPAAMADWKTIVEPLIRKAQNATDPEQRANYNVQADHALAQLIHKYQQSGGSGQDADIWGGSGQTFKTLEQMAAKGPHEIVTSTTGGKHATNSYHYKGQAIDLADKVGSVDSPGLLAINKYLAKNYGHKLAELIYAGPGGINIKDGKVVSGLGTFGSATMAEHHNHVHMAATPASLGMSGGVDVGGGGGSDGGPSSAASSGGFGSPASSGMGMGDLFRSSSGDALLAALASGGSGGSGGAGGVAGSPGSPGGGQGSAGGSGGPPGTMPKGTLAQWERQGLALVGLSYNKYAPGLSNLISHESGGNPKAINLWDSNAKAGHPSKGLMQEIDSTFNAYALPGHKNIWNPVDNIAAGVKYIEHTYGLGMLQAGGRRDAHGNYIGYARGVAEVIRDEVAQLHKGEMVVAAPEAKLIRQVAAQANAGGGTVRRGGGTVPVQLVFVVTQGGEQEARAHAARFARYVAEDHDITMVATR
jgi:hypothetical protein